MRRQRAFTQTAKVNDPLNFSLVRGFGKIAGGLPIFFFK